MTTSTNHEGNLLDGSKPIKLYRLTAWVGPTRTPAISEALRRAGLIDVFAGTDHVYWTISANNADHAMQRSQALLISIHGTDFGLWQKPAPRVLKEL